jgi:hypothetical protein
MHVIRVVPRHAVYRLVLAATLLGCAGAPGTSRPSVDRNVLVRSQFADRGYKSAYEVVQALRSTWLSARGTDSFNTPTEVQVYLDDMRLGGVETLKTIDVQSLASMRFFDGNAATARWGLGHGAGVIYLSTRVGDGEAKPPTHD